MPPSAVAVVMIIFDPTTRPEGASVQTDTMFAMLGAAAAVVGQPGTVAGEATGPSCRLLTVTSVTISGVKPTAPFHVNPGVYGPGKPIQGLAPKVAPSVVAGSPRSRGVVGLTSAYGVLKTFGNWVDGRPFATSAKPESGPKENMN